MFTIQVFLFLIEALVVGLLMYMPVMRKSEAFFGVRVSEEFLHGEGRRILRGYWFWCALTFLTTQFIGFLTLRFSLWPAGSLILPELILLTTVFALYMIFHHRVKPYQQAPHSSRVASSLQVKNLWDFTNLPFETLLAVFTLAPAIALLYFYPELPQRIPVHWGLSGEPDRWAAKSIRTVFALPLLAIYMQGLFLLLKVGMARSKMTLPAENTATYLRLKEEFLRVSIKMLDWVRAPLAALLGLIMLLLPLSVLPQLGWLKTPVNVAVWFSVAGLLAASLYGIARLSRINSELQAKTGQTYAQTSNDAAHWNLGGLIYNNPDDPSLMVEKLNGLGYTLNMGNKVVWLFMAYLLLLPLFVVFLMAEF